MYDPAPVVPVVLVHGLWLNGLEFFLLRDRLRRAGFAPSVFHYHSMHATLPAAGDELAGCLRDLGATVHVIAHSLGGLVACEAYARHPDLPTGRVVLMGSPIRGSRTARAVASHWFGPAALGPLALAELARERKPMSPLSREVGVIAGSLPIGIGRAFAELPQPNDGTVSVAETALPGATSRIVHDISHTGMLFSSVVAESAVKFLATGRFG
ncbi:MAG: alpha/beta hydrolase [Gammaproteobacteria bacterium]|nr:alpha/beta hydrolase [Gammaproteobacteria bacterium]